MCVSICLLVCVSVRHAQLCYWLNMQTGKQQPVLSAWDRDPGSLGALGWAPAAGQEKFPPNTS